MAEALSGNRKFRARPGTRKELRKAARSEKKSLRNGPPPTKRAKTTHEGNSTPNYHQQAIEPIKPIAPAGDQDAAVQKRKSILKKTKRAAPESKDGRERSITPPARMSRSVKDKLAEDDKEIAALEQKLGLRGKKSLPQSFKDDGLDELLEGLGDEED